GRDVFLTFDSDAMLKRAVYAALSRLREVLKQRKAHVRLVYLPAGEGGAKTGLDDFLAAGHGVDDLLRLVTTELRPPPDDGRDRRAPYAATAHGLVWHKPGSDGTTAIALTNFNAVVTAEIVRDDGAETAREYEIEARVAGTTR